MNDHETYMLLAAKRIHERLTPEEDAALEVHLVACPDCRRRDAAMRRDDLRLRTALTPVEVSPRVREAVLAEAARDRRGGLARAVLLLVAAMAVAIIGVPFITGGSSPRGPSASPPSGPVGSPQTAGPSPSTEPEPSSTAPTASVRGPSVAGAYTYQEQVERRDTIAARQEVDRPLGEWSRTTVVRGRTASYGGPITCFEVDGDEAWLAGPATTATDGQTELAIFFHYVDRGPDGEGDLAVGWLSTPGQTLATMEGWCQVHADPAGPFALTSGDVQLQGGP